jgi:hypothetical protein
MGQHEEQARNCAAPGSSTTARAALEVWRDTVPGAGSLVEVYLHIRHIELPVPLSLRYSAALRHGPTGLLLPAMVAAVQAPNGAVAAVHRTFLRMDGAGKAAVVDPKMALGSYGAGAVRLAAAGELLGLAEGVETGLAVMQLFGLPCWAALGRRFAAITLPAVVRAVAIFGDNDAPGVAAAHNGADAFARLGRRVVLRFPPEEFSDWNDALCRRSAT